MKEWDRLFFWGTESSFQTSKKNHVSTVFKDAETDSF